MGKGIRVDGSLLIQSEIPCVRSKVGAAVELARNELQPVFFESLEKTDSDVGIVGDLFQADAAKLTLAPQLFAKRRHGNWAESLAWKGPNAAIPLRLRHFYCYTPNKAIVSDVEFPVNDGGLSLHPKGSYERGSR